MFENALKTRNISSVKITAFKTLLTVGFIALAVLLPQIVHIALGAPGGMKWLPMYLPALVGGCLLGSKWGFFLGALSPLVSFLLTSSAKSPMPAATRLPYMMVEIAVFAVVAGLFTDKITEKSLWAFPAVWLAQISGRTVFLLSVAFFGRFSGLTVPVVWGQILSGWPGLVSQAVIVPLMIIALRRIMVKND